jgi:hypothetical protein
MIEKLCNVAGSGSVAHPEAWSRCKGCQSFTDANTCMTNMKWHLVNSSQHYMSPEDVDILFHTLEAEVEEIPKHYFDDLGSGTPATPPLDAAQPPEQAPPQHLLPKRQRTCGGRSASGSGGSSGGVSSISLQVDRAELSDMLTLRRSTLLVMLDCVERAAIAAKHAVAMSTAARDGFEKEERRLSDCATQLARICER